MLTHTRSYQPPDPRSTQPSTKPIGELLIEAGLLSSSQVELALQEQEANPQFLFGEIVALKGWLKHNTINFFVRDWQIIISQRKKQPIGHYFKQAGLIDEAQILEILQEQRETGIRFGTVAVFQGYLNAQTLEFFLESLHSQPQRRSARRKRHLNLNSRNHPGRKKLSEKSYSANSLRITPEVNQDDSIIWIG